MLDAVQVRELLIRPTLKALQMWTPSSENLVFGTALVESNLVYLKQINGPALSPWMIEPATYLDLRKRLMNNYSKIYQKILSVLCMEMLPQDANFLVGNLTAAIIMARIKYYFDPYPLPDYKDFMRLALYHKRVYNTNLGDTEVEESSKVFKQVCEYNFL